MSFRLRQIAQQTAATPTQIYCLILICWLESQKLNIWLIDLGGVKPVAKKDNPPNHPRIMAVQEEMIDSLITITSTIFLTSYPIFPSEVIFS